ncbi:MAG: IS3 family transposase [Chitinophagaceae bacterium]|nr:IS3 family transposase [Chitinophagaceae bacterium]
MRYKDKASIDILCRWTDVAKSSLYYHAHPGPRGMKASTYTIIGDCGLVPNSLVTDQIRAILSMDYCVYGYRKMTKELQELEYHINHKKVYRLMKESHLLSGKRIQVQGKRKWVKHRRIETKRPMEYLCLDIKYIWVQGERRWYYQLAIMDVFSRRILCWILQSSVRQTDVIALMRWLDLRFGLKGVIIRNDNGSQFIAHSVREVLQSLEAKQEFTHVATPEENAYIEAFHSIEQSELIDRHSFSSYYDAKQHIEKYMHWYNFKRRHGAIGFMTPMKKWKDFYSKTLFTFTLSGKAETGSAGGQPARNNLTNEEDQQGMPQIVPCLCGSSLLPIPQKTQLGSNNDAQNEQSVANLFEKIVQFIGG